MHDGSGIVYDALYQQPEEVTLQDVLATSRRVQGHLLQKVLPTLQSLVWRGEHDQARELFLNLGARTSVDLLTSVMFSTYTLVNSKVAAADCLAWYILDPDCAMLLGRDDVVHILLRGAEHTERWRREVACRVLSQLLQEASLLHKVLSMVGGPVSLVHLLTAAIDWQLTEEETQIIILKGLTHVLGSMEAIHCEQLIHTLLDRVLLASTNREVLEHGVRCLALLTVDRKEEGVTMGRRHVTKVIRLLQFWPRVDPELVQLCPSVVDILHHQVMVCRDEELKKHVASTIGDLVDLCAMEEIRSLVVPLITSIFIKVCSWSVGPSHVLKDQALPVLLTSVCKTLEEGSMPVGNVGALLRVLEKLVGLAAQEGELATLRSPEVVDFVLYHLSSPLLMQRCHTQALITLAALLQHVPQAVQVYVDHGLVEGLKASFQHACSGECKELMVMPECEEEIQEKCDSAGEDGALNCDGVPCVPVHAVVKVMQALLDFQDVIRALLETSDQLNNILTKELVREDSTLGPAVLRIYGSIAPSTTLVFHRYFMEEAILCQLIYRIKLEPDVASTITSHDALSILNRVSEHTTLGHVIASPTVMSKIMLFLWGEVKGAIRDPRYTPQLEGTLRLLLHLLHSGPGGFPHSFSVADLKILWWFLEQLPVGNPGACLIAASLWQLVTYSGEEDVGKIKQMYEIGIWDRLIIMMRQLAEDDLNKDMAKMPCDLGSFQGPSTLAIRVHLTSVLFHVLTMFEKCGPPVVKKEMGSQVSTMMGLWSRYDKYKCKGVEVGEELYRMHWYKDRKDAA